MEFPDDDTLFSAFAAPPPPAWHDPLNTTAASFAPITTAVSNVVQPPAPFGSMGHECLASVAFSTQIDPESRRRVDEAFRGSTVASSGTIPSPPAGLVHYYQAFSADYSGVASAASAAALPRPKYDRLFEEALPRAVVQPVQRRRPGFQGRYFDEPAAEVKPGVLSEELRKQLGIGPNDPPPYLNRMRSHGYPPGYRGDPSAQADGPDNSQLRFITDAPNRPTGTTSPSATSATQVPLVDFPGINVPPPVGADPMIWGWRGPIAPPALRSLPSS